MKIFKIILVIFFFTLALGFGLGVIYAQDSSGGKLDELNKKIDEYQQKITELQGQQKTLASTISFLDNNISLMTTQIAKSEEEITILEADIAKLTVKIGQLDTSLNELTKILTSRIGATYKNLQAQPVYMLFSSRSFSSFLTRIKYLKIAQAHDRLVMYEMERQKNDYDTQKITKEKKQSEIEKLKKILEGQKQALARNKQEKQALLEATKNDEKKYQEMLAAARAELEAIQSIIAGQGQESEAGEAKKGQRIATIISGRSACSSGTHLHFQVVKDNNTQDPASWLKNISITWDNSPDGPFSFNGAWDWPIDEPARVTQGYGNTYWSRIGWYGGGPHTGLDVDSDSSDTVKSVADGSLFRGSIACGGGTLRYVHVKHKDGDMDTYYLHVNYY